MRRRFEFPQALHSRDSTSYPLFQGNISQWFWKVYSQRLTRAGRWFALVTAIFAMYGGVTHELQGFVLAGYVSAMWGVAVAGAVVFRPRATLAVHMGERVCAGEELAVRFEVKQLGKWSGGDLFVVANELPVGVEASPDEGVGIADLARGERAEAKLVLRGVKRGAYALRGFRVESAFPFGIIRSRRVFDRKRKLLVYPKFFALARLELPTGRRYQPGGVALASNLGESFEYLGNREYREGDNVRDIDWRATARVGRPIVREWVEEYMLRVAVVLDTHVPNTLRGKALGERRETFECAVSVAAAVSDYMARQDYLVDVFAAGPNLYHLVAGRSLAYLDQILDILACVGESTDEPFTVIEPQIAELLERLSTVICVFVEWNEARRNFVQTLAEHGVAVKVILMTEDHRDIDLADAATISKAEFEKGVTEL